MNSRLLAFRPTTVTWPRRNVLSTLTLLVALLGAGSVRAQAPAWDQTGLGEPTERLFTPATGAFFALTRDRLLRSDDAGTTWRPLAVPAEAGQRGLRAAVDPTDPAVIYAGGANGLFRSADAGATWTPLTAPPPARPTTAEAVEAIAVSPADPRLVYLALTGNAGISDHFRFLHSRDAGATWEQLDEQNNSLCGWGVRLLLPHPTDPQRVFRVAACLAGRDLGDTLWQSRDQGATWTPLLAPRNTFPVAFVGGAGARPERYFLAADRDPRAGGGAYLFGSNDDAGTWTEVAAWAGPGSPAPADAPNPRVGGLTYDPERPDRVYVALNEAPRQAGKAATGSRVVASRDSGATWSDVGGPDLPPIRALALGIDARNLYAATEQGVWRLPQEP